MKTLWKLTYGFMILGVLLYGASAGLISAAPDQIPLAEGLIFLGTIFVILGSLSGHYALWRDEVG